MPPGAKKRKALKKKQQQQQQQEAIGTSTNNNLHGGNEEEEHGSQDDRESDSSNLSSPGSQGNEQFGGTKGPPSAAMVKKDTAKEMANVTQGLGPESVDKKAIAVERGTDDKKEKPPVTSYENGTQTSPKNVASHHLSVKKIASVADSVSKVVISEHAEASSTKSNLVKQKENIPSTELEKENGKLATLPGSAAGTSKMVESVRESQVPLSPEEKQPLLLPGPPPAVRTSWLSCCGLFDAMTGSER